MIEMFNVPVSDDGSIQLPDELREKMGGDPIRELVFLIRDGAIHVLPLRKTAAEVAGSLPPLPFKPSGDYDDEIEAALDEALRKRYS
jgi:bifunctional DNA-binding transcriptional regulator/antitoxin component of YhaV-PrlF toxin-antitoxin module